MFNGMTKAVTFSYDDGVTQDMRLASLFEKYGLKATFNLNSGVFGNSGRVSNSLGTASHNKVKASDVSSIYAGQEIAVHTRTHPNLTGLPEAEVISQVEDDRRALEALAGYPIIGMAYPCGGVNNDDRTAEIIRKNTPIKYARTITSNGLFAPQKNLMRFEPTVWHLDFDAMFSLAEKFLADESGEPMIFYIWGHSYEFDYNDTWGRFEDFCRLISGRNDIFYATNRQALLGK